MDELGELKRQLEGFNRRFWEFVEVLPVGMFQMTPDGIVQYVNSEVILYFGFSEDNLPTNVHARDLFTEASRKRAERMIAALNKGRQIRGRPLTAIRTDGSEFEVLIYAVPIVVKGVITGSRGILMDISGQKAMMAQLQEERSRISHINSLGILAGGIAHDFNNILAALLGNVEVLRSELEPNSKQFEIIEDMAKAIHSAASITKQLLTFSKGGGPVWKMALIEPILRSVVSLALRGSNCQSDFKINPNLPPTRVDPHQFSQVINNLAINAKQAMPEGGTITVTADLQYYSEPKLPIPKAGHYLHIGIRDEGVGIPVDIQGDIFKPYFSTKPQGHGLGLAVSHSIIEKHGGKIWFKSAPDQGTIFHIILPTDPANRIQEEPTPFEIDQFSGKVLILEDLPVVQRALQKMLINLGFEVIVTAEGKETIQEYLKCRENQESLEFVILDLTIPGGMGGVEVWELLKAEDPALKAIVTTGYSDSMTADQFKERGILDVLYKPYTLGDLYQILKRNIGE